MKFAKELEQDLVPEWRAKYLDYKAGKKQVRAVGRAIARANGSPRIPGIGRQSSNRNTPSHQPYTPSRLAQVYSGNDDSEPAEPSRQSSAPMEAANSRTESEESSEDQNPKATTPMLIGNRHNMNKDSNDGLQYGSFIPTPPAKDVQHFELPGPALTSVTSPSPSAHAENQNGVRSKSKSKLKPPLHRTSSLNSSGNAYEVGRPIPSPRSTFHILPSHTQPLSRPPSTLGDKWSSSPKAFMQRVMSSGRVASVKSSDLGLPAFDQVRARQKDFFQWMDKELEKIESFYKSKEEEAGERLKLLREQLHEMRNRRIEEIAEARKAKNIRKEEERALDPFNRKGLDNEDDEHKGIGSREQLRAWMLPIENAIANAKSRTHAPRPGVNSKALVNMYASPDIRPADSARHRNIESGRDYIRKPQHEHDVPYRAAKRKLKLALKEYYRGLELLKSYALLNRTAFRKINKKYDKVVNARPTLRYMSEKVNTAEFVRSSVVEEYIQTVEDLYSRYFERGNHKVAVGKLRSSLRKSGEHANSAFRSGIFMGTGAVFAIQGLIYAVDLLYHSPDPNIQVQTSYLLQIYGGYFLALDLFMWFCWDCHIWTQNKINYAFIFEFDTRNNLDWRQLAEFPAFFLLVLGLCMWLNFSRYGAPEMFIYYPVILIFVTTLIIFMPAPVLFHRSRKWFVYSNWRVLLAGLYPVEFRDFLLGDMYCSLTFLMSNLELFFCLYAQNWADPPQCNSTHSRLLGFFSTLPGIWRALQCVRRYWDTGNVFPHLVNCGKYSSTILYYMTLSIYRVQETNSHLAIFITFAAINSVYCIIWDLAMDWSLCQPLAQKRFLRDVRGFKVVWPYYLAMIIDPILRFNWVFYALYTHDLQHSSIVSFLIAFTEVSRRGMWTLFRVENEHCANVVHFKASRDIPLPYDLPVQESDTFTNEHHEQNMSTESQATTTQASPQLSRHRSRTSATAPTAAEEGQAGPSTLRHRPPNRRMTLTQIFADAHTQDFEKKRKTGPGDSDVSVLPHNSPPGFDDGFHGGGHSSDEDDEDGEEDELKTMVATADRLARRHRQSNGEHKHRKDNGKSPDMNTVSEGEAEEP